MSVSTQLLRRKESAVLAVTLPAAMPEAPKPIAPKIGVMSNPGAASIMTPVTPSMMYIMTSGFPDTQSLAYFTEGIRSVTHLV